MFSPVVEVIRLTKVFNSIKVVDGVSFSIFPGEIVGLLGPNGAGKTTILHMLLGLTAPTSGEIRIFNQNFERYRSQILEKVNFSSSYVSLPYSLTVKESLKVFAWLYGVKNREKKIEEVLTLFEIKDISSMPVRTLSSGQITRVNLAKAFINDPQILFLDEPTASLDPDIADKTRHLLKKIKEEKKISILYTSHNMKEMQEVSDRILFLYQGRLIATGTPAEVISKFKGEDLEEVFIKIAREKLINQ
ncbi:MAG: ABC transporter ATP-binding protein [Candidatus Aminicenantes bacterium]|nr:ABC transporter ATP-binding protein [Candidatus Aminicenantes bacterium]